MLSLKTQSPLTILRDHRNCSLRSFKNVTIKFITLVHVYYVDSDHVFAEFNLILRLKNTLQHTYFIAHLEIS